jgi:hypothetical protein
MADGRDDRRISLELSLPESLAAQKPGLRIRAGHMANTRVGGSIARSCHRLERGGNGFIDSFEPNKFEFIARPCGDILEVLPVPRRQHDALPFTPTVSGRN